MFSVGHELITAIVAAAQDTFGPGVHVSDGFHLAKDRTSTLMIGVDDINGSGASIDGARDFATTGLDGTSQEEASILCASVAYDGGGKQENARQAVFDLADQVESLCRIRGGTDPAFGVTQAMWTHMGRSFTLYQPPSDLGAVAILQFRIYYEARV